MADSLKQKTLNGLFWSAIDIIAGQGIVFVVGIVLARLLTPEIFGQIGIIAIFIGIFDCIVGSGFGSALIRKPNATEDDFSTVFVANLVTSFLLAGVLFISAPYIADFFHTPDLENPTKVMSLIIIINALAIVQETKLSKSINFKAKTRVSLVAALCSGVFGIASAYAGAGIWAIVVQQMSRNALNTIGLWMVSKWTPRLHFSVESFKELFGYSWKLLVTGLLNSLWNQLYQVVIGRFYTATDLGYYTRANQFTNFGSSSLTSVIQRVTFPVLSNIQEDKAQLKNAYRRVLRCTMFMTIVCMYGLLCVSKPLVILLVGEKWLECVPMMQILCITMSFYPVHSLNLNLLQVQGRSDLYLKIDILKKFVGLGPVAIGIIFNIQWMLFTGVLANLICLCINSYYSGPFINYSTWSQIKDIIPSVLVGLCMIVVDLPISFLNISYSLMLTLQIFVCFLTILAVCELFNLYEYKEIKTIIFETFKRRRHG